MKYEGRWLRPIRVEKTGGTTYKVKRTKLKDIKAVVSYLETVEANLRDDEKVRIIIVRQEEDEETNG